MVYAVVPVPCLFLNSYIFHPSGLQGYFLFCSKPWLCKSEQCSFGGWHGGTQGDWRVTIEHFTIRLAG